MEPLVSVIMPAYNVEKYIEESVKSVLNQTYTNLELIIINDFSTDRTLEKIMRLKKKDIRIIIKNNKKNEGVSVSRNRGIKLARGKYISLIDSDDMWNKDKLFKQIKFMEKNKINISYTGYNQIEENGKIIKEIKVPEKLSYSDLLKNCLISCITGTFVREKFDEINFKKIAVEDFDFWLNILKKEKFAYGLTEPLASYRILKNSRSSNKIINIINIYKVYKKYQHIGYLKSTYLTIVYIIKWIKRNKF